jgi:hypothetical protein
MQHHAFGDGAAGSVGSLSVDMAAKGPVPVAWSPGWGNRAVGVWVKGLEGHEALERHRMRRRVPILHCLIWRRSHPPGGASRKPKGDRESEEGEMRGGRSEKTTTRGVKWWDDCLDE